MSEKRPKSINYILNALTMRKDNRFKFDLRICSITVLACKHVDFALVHTELADISLCMCEGGVGVDLGEGYLRYGFSREPSPTRS